MLRRALYLLVSFTTVSLASVFCPDYIKAKVESAIKLEPITQGGTLRGFRVFIPNEKEDVKIVVPLMRTKATWATTWDDYLELLYILPKDTLPRESFPIKALWGGKTYICTVKIYYDFYKGLVRRVE